MIQRWRSDRIGDAREGYQTNQITSAARQRIVTQHKTTSDILDRGKPIHLSATNLKIHGLHTGAAIDNHLHRDTLGIDDALLPPLPRTG